MDEIFAALTQVLSNRTLNEIKVGYASQLGEGLSLVEWPEPSAGGCNGITAGTPRITFTGFTIGSSANCAADPAAERLLDSRRPEHDARQPHVEDRRRIHALQGGDGELP